jgi:hypothetical protein
MNSTKTQPLLLSNASWALTKLSKKKIGVEKVFEHWPPHL